VSVFYVCVVFFFFFFFQAEDGIRDRTVTGVQTCALPICFGTRSDLVVPAATDGLSADRAVVLTPQAEQLVCRCRGWPVHEEESRSEERRVGKECRTRWAKDE